MIRRIASVLAAIGLLLALAAPVLAGGWATIVADAQTGKPPVEGQPITIGFKVMQHGVTPAPWETATVHLVDASTGDALDVPSRNDDPNGHFTANVTLPHAGYWTWSVALQDLAVQQTPVTITVRSTTGHLPQLDQSTVLAAIDRAKSEIATQYSNTVGAELERIDANAQSTNSRIGVLADQMSALSKERDALQARVGALESGQGGQGSVPILGVISLAVLAGAAAGFTMAWLAGRPGPKPQVTFNPTPRGVDPA
jgi:hypothetical protein